MTTRYFSLSRHCYDGVGIGPVLSAVNVPKGSFYHFFRSKEDFAIAVLEAYVARYASHRPLHFSFPPPRRPVGDVAVLIGVKGWRLSRCSPPLR
jgi:AcrR family transcriptional regulator